MQRVHFSQIKDGRPKQKDTQYKAQPKALAILYNRPRRQEKPMSQRFREHACAGTICFDVKINNVDSILQVSLYYINSPLLDDPGGTFIRKRDRVKKIATFNKVKYKPCEKRISGAG